MINGVVSLILLISVPAARLQVGSSGEGTHGGLIFVDLRDRSGLVQIVFSSDVSEEAHALAHDLRAEFVISVAGTVRKRPEGSENPNLGTGMVELYVDTLTVLNEAAALPFTIEEAGEASESLRLKYRYLDLRRPELQNNLIVRHRVTKLIRDYLDGQGFLRNRNTHADKIHARRRQGLSCAEQAQPGSVLCIAPITAAF